MSAEEIRASLEKEVRRRLREHMEALQEEFERLRIESRQRWEEFSDRFDFPIPPLVPAELVPEPAAAAPAKAPAPDLAGLRADILEMDKAASQVETLRTFLAGCLRNADRAVILIRKGDQLTVWKAEGFSGPDGAALGSLSLRESEEPALAAALGGSPLLLPGGDRICSRLRAADAAEAVLIPIVVRENVAAVLYADRRRGGAALAPHALALLGYLVGISIDRLATRRMTPAPALLPFRKWEAESSTATVAFPQVEIEPAAAPEADELAYSEAVEIPEPEAAEEAPALPAVEAPPRAEPPPPPPTSRGAAPDAEATAVGVRPPSGYAPPRPGTLRGPLAPGSEDPHEEARRVARLLVSDILLYNEAAVAEGKKNNDVYDRLKDDIERARQTYAERVPEAVRRSTNYFHEELIHALAGESSEA